MILDIDGLLGVEHVLGFGRAGTKRQVTGTFRWVTRFLFILSVVAFIVYYGIHFSAIDDFSGLQMSIVFDACMSCGFGTAILHKPLNLVVSNDPYANSPKFQNRLSQLVKRFWMFGTLIYIIMLVCDLTFFYYYGWINTQPGTKPAPLGLFGLFAFGAFFNDAWISFGGSYVVLVHNVFCCYIEQLAESAQEWVSRQEERNGEENQRDDYGAIHSANDPLLADQEPNEMSPSRLFSCYTDLSERIEALSQSFYKGTFVACAGTLISVAMIVSEGYDKQVNSYVPIQTLCLIGLFVVNSTVLWRTVHSVAMVRHVTRERLGKELSKLRVEHKLEEIQPLVHHIEQYPLSAGIESFEVSQELNGTITLVLCGLALAFLNVKLPEL